MTLKLPVININLIVATYFMKHVFISILIISLFIFGCTKVPEKTDAKPMVTIEKGIEKMENIPGVEKHAPEPPCIAPQNTCLDEKTILNYSCENNKLKTIQTSCPEGNVCKEGSCILKIPEIKSGCEDTDGVDTTIQGTTTYQGKTYQDSCNSLSIVKEYYCKGEKLENSLKTCLSGTTCQQGACKEAPAYCKDTDNGLNSTKYGEVTIEKGNSIRNIYADTCITTTSINEYYCDNEMVKNKTIECDPGANCKNNVCGKIDYCTDSDGGINSIIKGTVTVLERRETEQYSNSFNDQCLDQNTLQEYYCLTNMLASQKTPCVGGCDNGRCFQ